MINIKKIKIKPLNILETPGLVFYSIAFSNAFKAYSRLKSKSAISTSQSCFPMNSLKFFKNLP